MPLDEPLRRWGYTEMSRQLVERGAGNVDVLRIAIDDALQAAGMTADDRYYVRVSVIELPADCENWPWEGASSEVTNGDGGGEEDAPTAPTSGSATDL